MPRSVDALLVEHMGWAKRLARKLASQHPSRDVDEMIGEALVALVEAAGRYNPRRGSFKNFAGRRIEGAILDRIRRDDPAGRHQRTMEKQGVVTELAVRGIPHQVHGDIADLAEEKPGAFPSLDPPQEAVAIRAEKMAQLASLIDWLPEKKRHVLALYYLEDMTFAEIGRVLDMTLSRACQIHTEATAWLREMYDGDDDEEGEAAAA